MRGYLVALAVVLGACDEGADPCECAYPGHCVGSTCTLDCEADEDCEDPTLLCAGGTCTSRCKGVLCDEGSYCDASTAACVPDPDRTCIIDLDCEDPTMRCDHGLCRSRCAGVDCDTAAGQICDPRTGTCAGGRTCTTRADCARLGPNVVCEDGLCSGDRLAACNAERPCASGLTCVGDTGYAFCAAPCESASDCRTGERCVEGGGYDGHCVINLCRPGGGPLGLYQDVDFMEPCDAAGSGDGLCLGPLPGDDGPNGICQGRGTAATGTPCRADATIGSAQACASALCIGAEITGVGTCLEGCSLFDGQSCPPLPDRPTACFPVLAANGVCAPQLDPPVESGEACMPVAGQLPCAEDHACLPVPLGMTCQPLCALAARPGEPGACAAGTCTQVDPNNAVLGACR